MSPQTTETSTQVEIELVEIEKLQQGDVFRYCYNGETQSWQIVISAQIARNGNIQLRVQRQGLLNPVTYSSAFDRRWKVERRIPQVEEGTS